MVKAIGYELYTVKIVESLREEYSEEAAVDIEKEYALQLLPLLL